MSTHEVPGVAADVRVHVVDWRALGRHLAGAADPDQVEFLLGFMEELVPVQAAWIAAGVARLDPTVQHDLRGTLMSVLP